METTDRFRYLRARDKVEALKKFYRNLTLYLLFASVVGLMHYVTSPWPLTGFVWGVAGWGIGLAFQAFRIFGVAWLFGPDWETRKIKAFMEKDRIA